ncbi:hypothetical protein FACS1894140_1850 [Spirochaetia bacterium]|nr:hypothetical protein FACS1894140_1850 [Spirochaetia bacterium]
MDFLPFNAKIEELKRGQNEGYCRICGKWDKLTIDHVPPKSCGNLNKIEIDYGKGKLISQNGLNCKTICSQCNNTLLGRNYDQEIIKLYNDVLSLSNSTVPETMDFSVDVNSLVRCLLGHFIAINVYDENKSVQNILSDKINDGKYIFGTYRKFVNGETSSLDDIICYYWYYPYNEIKMIPYFAKANVLDLDKPRAVFGTLIKFFPVALYLINDKSSSASLNGVNKIDFNTNKITFDFKNIMHNDFPEMPSPGEVILINSGSSFNVTNERK